jgi:hypothetical protein
MGRGESSWERVPNRRFGDGKIAPAQRALVLAQDLRKTMRKLSQLLDRKAGLLA